MLLLLADVNKAVQGIIIVKGNETSLGGGVGNLIFTNNFHCAMKIIYSQKCCKIKKSLAVF